MASFTKGPWSFDGENDRTIYGPPDRYGECPTICDVLDTTEGLEGDCPEAEANGRLIAASPEMYALLTEAFENLPEWAGTNDGAHQWWVRVCALLAKAPVH